MDGDSAKRIPIRKSAGRPEHTNWRSHQKCGHTLNTLKHPVSTDSESTAP